MQCYKRKGKLKLFRSALSKHERYSKSFTKTLYGSKFLVSESILKLVCLRVGGNHRFNVRL